MPRHSLERKTVSLLFVLVFFCSGAAGLAYQMVWAKAFAAGIGHEFPSVLAVVTAFMAGMTLGNLLLVRRQQLSPKLYGRLELVIGLWGFVTIPLIPFVERAVTSLLGISPSPSFQWIVVFAAVFLALLPATAAMGATVPAAERFLTGRSQKQTTGLLYAANTAGAVVGAVLAAYVLMPWLGLRGCLIAFASVNIFCGLAALVLAEKQTSPQNPQGNARDPLAPNLLARLFFIGLLGIGFELTVIRALAHVLENTVYTFAVVLAVYLLGNALGAFWMHRRQRKGSLRWHPNHLFLLLAISCALVALTLRVAHDPYLQLRSLFGDSLAGVALAESLTATLFFLVPAFFMGSIWTHLTQSSLSAKPSLAAAVAINTAGAAVAPIIFGLIVFPLLGLKGALAIFPAGYALLAGRSRPALIALLILLAAVPAFSSARHLIQTDRANIISLTEGVMGSVAVLQFPSGDRVLKFNNRFQMGGTAARIAEERQAAVPLLLHPDPKRALFIGVGTGISLAGARHFPQLHVDAVELVPEIARAVPFFNESAPLAGTNLNLIVADGRRFVRASRQRYDVIIGDLFHPAQDGAGFLYTREHFAAVRDNLTASGFFCQWLPVYQMDRATLETVMATFAQIFSRNEIWLLRPDVDLPVIGLIGHRGLQSGYDTNRIAIAQSSAPALGDQLRRLGLHDTFRLLGSYIGPIPKLDAPVNTDGNPRVVFRAPAVTFQKSDDPVRRFFAILSDFQRSSVAILPPAQADFASPLNDYIRARDIYLRALAAERAGDRPAALGSYIESSRVSPDFTLGYTQAIGIASALSRENSAEAKAILEKLIEAQPSRPVARELLRRIENTSNLSN